MSIGFLFILGLGQIHIPRLMLVCIYLSDKRHALLSRKKENINPKNGLEECGLQDSRSKTVTSFSLL